MKKHQYYIDVWGEVLPTPRGTMTAVATSNNKNDYRLMQVKSIAGCSPLKHFAILLICIQR